jgi:hypothetical protein
MSHKRTAAWSALLTVMVSILVPVFWAQSDSAPQVRSALQEPAKVNFAAPLPDGPMAMKASTACTECHEARIILQQRLNKAAWTKEVDKMVKWGAVVEAGDRDALIEYLSANFSPDQPPSEAPRTSTEKAVGKNSESKTAK